jgi:hypothetical protein
MDHDTSPETMALWPPPDPGKQLAVDVSGNVPPAVWTGTYAPPAMPAWRAEIEEQLGHTDAELILALSPQELWRDGRPDLAHTALQCRRAFAYIEARTGMADQGKVCARAAVIAGAPICAPRSELEMGVRHAPDLLTGCTVRCRSCRQSWTCLGGDYWDGTTKTNGLCFGCLLADTRTDLAQPVLTGKIIAPRRRRKGGKRAPTAVREAGADA